MITPACSNYLSPVYSVTWAVIHHSSPLPDTTPFRSTPVFLYSTLERITSHKMSNENKFHEYFNRNHESWGILDFLNECNLESFDHKTDCYIKSLRAIADFDHGRRQECARILLDNYNKASKNSFLLEDSLKRTWRVWRPAWSPDIQGCSLSLHWTHWHRRPARSLWWWIGNVSRNTIINSLHSMT